MLQTLSSSRGARSVSPLVRFQDKVDFTPLRFGSTGAFATAGLVLLLAQDGFLPDNVRAEKLDMSGVLAFFEEVGVTTVV